MTGMLEAAGLRLPLEDADGGPVVSTTAEPELAPLAWVLNAGATGMLPGLRDAVAAGEDAVVQGLYATRPDPREDHAAAAAAWRRRTGREPAADAYVVGTTFAESGVLLPRAALLELLDALARVREGSGAPHAAPGAGGPAPEVASPASDASARARDGDGDTQLDDLERRAAEVDALADAGPASAEAAGALAAKRRVLLLLLDGAGVLGDEPPPEVARYPCLAGYREAADALRRYLGSEERRARVADPEPARVVGAHVSLDWFRRPSPRPDPGEPPHRWLAVAEATLRAAPLDEQAGAGEVYLRGGGGWWVLDWRRDDGVTPALVRARRAG